MDREKTTITAVFSVVFLIVLVLVSIGFKNYEKEIDKQKKEIKTLKADKEWLMKQILKLQDKDCSWLENYYYNNITQKDSDWIIIDGAYYEYKRELTPQEQFGEAWQE